MAGFLRDILTTLSYEPAAADQIPADGAALSRLDQRLAGFVQNSGQNRSAITIRPNDCSVWDGNPRDQPGLTSENCRSLIESIAQEDGNRIPVLVRRNPPGSDAPYELIVGSRRRFSVDWLNHNGRPEIRLNALVVDLSDEEAFRLADIENREREDITELDRARSYQNAVDRFYGGGSVAHGNCAQSFEQPAEPATCLGPDAGRGGRRLRNARRVARTAFGSADAATAQA
ncbi:chromosome partitioning protein, ParB family (plasmid) [Novosphingobium sp. PP1Y]|nr:chromosome partitioning protein, ParB family [Novosphingobium sp. PP1Y]